MGKTVANLNDVANLAGVSKSTVSRVLNNKLGNGFSVRPELQQKINEIAQQLNYRPNLMAMGLAKQRNRMISVIGGAHALSDLGNIYQSVINSITKVFDSTNGGFDVMVDMSQHSSESSELPAWRIEGIIVLAKCSKQTFDELSARSMPYIVINGPVGENGSSVVPDDVGGTKLAVNHLANLGHKKIAYANAPLTRLSGHNSMVDRHNTYKSQLKEYGLEPVKGHDVPLTCPEEFLKYSIREKGATAVISYGHMNALNLMQAAHLLGLAIPKDFSLICFCDSYATDVMSPGLTFIDLRAKEMGVVAAKLLLEMIEAKGNFETVHKKLEERLVIRETTASVPMKISKAI